VLGGIPVPQLVFYCIEVVGVVRRALVPFKKDEFLVHDFADVLDFPIMDTSLAC
jgi:hypothetical protein